MHPILLNTNISQSGITVATPLYGVMDQSPYGYWNQGLTWGSQHGLTYMWPMVHYTIYGSCGPRLVDLNNGIFPQSSGAVFATAQDWPGIGNDPYTQPEINGACGPWNTSTGYIGLTFGATGFLDIRTAQRIVSENRWIPEKYRVFSPFRIWRFITSTTGITGTEDITLTSGLKKSHWLKRKMSFLRAELKAFCSYTGSTGFFFGGGIENDDEFYQVYNFTDLNDGVNFKNLYVYPNNSPTGSSWYASFSGQSAAPDSLIAEGITSFRAFLLTRGWTTNPSSFKFIDGITAQGSAGVSGNIAATTSRDMWLGNEFAYALKDWTAAHWQDLFNDFKLYNNHLADNILYSSYGYYYNNAGISGYRLLNPSLPNSTFLTNLFNIGSTDAIPYPLSPSTKISDANMRRYYSYDNMNPNPAFPGNVGYRIPGSISSINTYGAFPGPSVYNSGYVLDRTLDYKGNSYNFANNGKTYGIGMIYGFMMEQQYSSLGSPLNTPAKKWIPANYLGTTTGLPALVNCATCAETIGSCQFRQFDLTGSSGSTFPIAIKAGFDRSPELQSWHLNPVWGITFIPATASYGPANYIPVLTADVITGITYGKKTLEALGTGKTWFASHFDACMNPYPGNTLPAGSLYNHYWSNWYPMHFIALLQDVSIGRQFAVNNVTRAVDQRNNPSKQVPNSIWNGIQKPINIWIANQKWRGDTTKIDSNYYIPTGLTFGYYIQSFMATGTTFPVGEAGPMYYENIRHQYLNKVGRYSYWGIFSYTCVTTSVGGQVPAENQTFPRRMLTLNTQNPQLPNGLTSYGICGAMAMALVRKVNTVIGECDTIGNGMVKETVNLAPINLDERTYLASGAQKIDGNFLWRITFSNPATDPSPIIIRGSCSGITTGYNVSGITDYNNNSNNKFGVWWTTGNLEYPIVDNPPIPEALRFNKLNLVENPAFMFNATTTAEGRQVIPKDYINPDLFCTMSPPYGWWRQAERWGSQNGLTYMWPVMSVIKGRNGPSQSNLNAGIFPPSAGVDQGWTGVGFNNNPDVDIDMSVAPWNSATGYIGLTFGATGFYSKAGLDRFAQDYAWIPNKYRVLFADRWWRAQTNSLLPDTEIITMSNGNTIKSPWLKRKVNFLRTELRAIYGYLSGKGFTMAHIDFDDEIYNSLANDIGNIPANGDSNFYFKYLYPNNGVTGSNWYSNFYGSCAAPDCLIARGITSMRSHLLTKGFTGNPSNYRYVEGLTAVYNSPNADGNIAMSGSPFQFLKWEYISAIQDWYAGHWNDFVDDFKLYNGISADNSLSADYGYYKLNNAVINFTDPSYTNNFYVNNNRLSNSLNRTNSDYVPYVTTVDPANKNRSKPVFDYYAYNDAYNLDSVVNLLTEQVGDVGSIHTYGGILQEVDPASNSPRIIDRNLDWRGNTYGLATNGVTYGKNIGNWYWNSFALIAKYGSNSPVTNTNFAKKFFPAGWLGSNAAAQVKQFPSCGEIMGQTGFFMYDPTGASGSCAANSINVSFDRTPHFVSWHLNPVWGININRFSSGQVSGPANYLPIHGPDIYFGLTYGAKTVFYMAGGTGIPSDKLDPCGNPFPAVNLPAGTIYNNYWTNWYPMAFMTLLMDVKWGRQVAKCNVSKAVYERKDPVNNPKIPGSKWYGIQKPINTWIAHQKWTNDDHFNLTSNSTVLSSTYYVPQGITFGYRTSTIVPATQLDGFTFIYGEAGPMYYENIRHQYLNKTGRYSYWNPATYDMTSSDGTPLVYMNESVCFGGRRYTQAQTSPQKSGGLTCLGVCGAMRMELARKINTVIGECQTIGSGTVWETTYLAPMNMDERSYLISGAQKVDGNYLWRITFAHPATQSPIIVRGSQSGITTSYNINGITDYINIPNNKFGIWWTTDRYEVPIVENPPVSEAERLGVLNLPGQTAFIYNPLSMTQAQLPFEVTSNVINPNMTSSEIRTYVPLLDQNRVLYGHKIPGSCVASAFGPNFTIDKTTYQQLVTQSLNKVSGNTTNKYYFGNTYPRVIGLAYNSFISDYINLDESPNVGNSSYNGITLLNDVLNYTREISSDSSIYHYGCPILPYSFLNQSTWANKSNADSAPTYAIKKNSLLLQQQQKIALMKINSDRIDISSIPIYTDGNTGTKQTSAGIQQQVFQGSCGAIKGLS